MYFYLIILFQLLKQSTIFKIIYDQNLLYLQIIKKFVINKQKSLGYMLRIALLIITIGQVLSDSCVYDVANFIDIYQILKTKQMIGLSQYSNNQSQTVMRILQNPNQNPQTPPPNLYDNYRVSNLFVPLQVIDMTSLLTSNPQSLFTIDLIKNWEKNFGKIPSDSIIFVRTNQNTKVFNGWETDALDFMFNSRNVIGIGHDQQLDNIPENQLQYFYNKLYISNAASLTQNNEYSNLVQIRKLSVTKDGWFVDIQSIIPQNVCSTPKRLVNQWWSVIIILVILLLIIYLIYYCCLKRFDKYNKEDFKPLDWEKRNQDGIYFNQEELHVPLQEMHESQQQQQKQQ
ncbi:transmembrane protein, putative (macronuclear) [Tetrahymena thermophila SB210]|uniref:Transmembrane protein, putative n=1 Tax=Tetrahymena thermophila (strain SB210) TaxID=312017 RepID=W7XIR6_TETTS|nr:transmembrane protein, putative [Tetrahymena thermophila SB210]EWS73549.1 transmembrane protein, putative [Tetrahymena thermophila SB210]|eukprot:XP_012653939.1 transmembrane protein, putative [Tetrahymena thermophila SB210]